MLQIMAQRQTNNYSSDFNLGDADVMLKPQRILRIEGCNVTFVVTSVDGVSCVPGNVKNWLRGFLRVKLESAHTDTNYNENNAR